MENYKRKRGEREGRGKGHPHFMKKQNARDTDLSTASIPSLSAFISQTLFTVTIILSLSQPPFMSVLSISFLLNVGASASPSLPTTKAVKNNLLFLSALFCPLWFAVFLLMGLISKTQSHIPARSN